MKGKFWCLYWRSATGGKYTIRSITPNEQLMGNKPEELLKFISERAEFVPGN